MNIRLADQIVIALGVVVLLVIGGISSRRSGTDEGYFFAGRSMPAWMVGFSLMATIVSSSTFLFFPAFTFGESNWRNGLTPLTFVPAVFFAVVLIIPIYRAARTQSAYEYLERRFGLWARLYAAACFVLFHFVRTGLVLFGVSLAIKSILGMDDASLPIIIIIGGILVSAYTIVGGLQAVIWTDVFQGITLIGGGLICLPVIVLQLPGGFTELFSVAVADNKFDLGSTEFTLTEKTLWAYVCAEFVLFLHFLVTDQTNVQRYCAAESDRAATKAAIIGCCLAVPTWIYFLFLGTCLYVFVKVVPNTGLQGLNSNEIFPQFILTQVPPGLAGLVLTGLLAAAMSTLDSSINATSATVTIDFYKRLWVKHRDPRHYANVGKLISLLFSLVMIAIACGIHYYRISETTLDDLQRMLLSIFSGGLLSLFLLGFLTRRVDSRAAITATVTALALICGWMFMDTPYAKDHFPKLAAAMPGNFWVSVFANLLLFGVAYTLSLFIGSRHGKSLAGLTVWRQDSDKPDAPPKA